MKIKFDINKKIFLEVRVGKFQKQAVEIKKNRDHHEIKICRFEEQQTEDEICRREF